MKRYTRYIPLVTSIACAVLGTIMTFYMRDKVYNDCNPFALLPMALGALATALSLFIAIDEAIRLR